jgi:hypothetical protein
MHQISRRYFVVVCAVFLAIAQAAMPATGQTANSAARDSQKKSDTGNNGNNPPVAHSTSAKQIDAPAIKSETSEDSTEQKNPTVNISESAAVPVEWRWYDKVAWGFNILLVLVGLAGIRIAINTLRNVARQTKAMEDSIRLQEAAYYQWVDVTNWRVKEGGKPACLIVEFDINNRTNFPLTLKESDITFKKLQPKTRHVIYGRFVPPNIPIHIEIDIDIGEAKDGTFKSGKNNFGISVDGNILFESVRGEVISQSWSGILVCEMDNTTFEYSGPMRRERITKNSGEEKKG